MNLTDQDKIDIVAKYQNGDNSIQLGKEYGVAKSTILSILKVRKIERRQRQNCNRKYSLNENFFEKIDSEASAYFLGLMYSDGFVTSRGSAAAIQLAEKDKKILEIFNIHLNSNKPLQFIGKRDVNYSNQFRLTMQSKKIYEDLIKLGCVERKSLILKFPTFDKVPENLIHHFIRGIFDGDGSVGFVPSTPDMKQIARFSIAGSYDICSKIRKIFNSEKFGIGKIHSNKNIFEIKCGGPHKIKPIINFLYRDATIFLQRKRDIFNKIILAPNNKKLIGIKL